MNSANIQTIRFDTPTAVLAALERQRGDFADLADEAATVTEAVAKVIQAPEDRTGARRALENQQAQLVWLAAETGAMLAALADTREDTAMPTLHQQRREIPTALHLYRLAASIEHVAETLPEEHGGLALILRMISGEVLRCGEKVDEAAD
ncbi:hypothetical protein [Desulfovibrio falkowii]|uniref:hypothetical protein n=1 Tax=Desulfovibrio sp. WGS1351 TaxID=3366814 RepID=UPI00372D4CD8